ncbi:MAG: ATP-grasp domain-containing protein [Nanobdellota archaeon]
MRIALISLGSKSSEMIADELEKYFSKVDIIDIREIEISVGNKSSGILYQGKPMEEYDCVFIRGSYKYAAIQRSIASKLYGKCYMPYPPSVFSIVHDKILTHLELENYGVPMPTTYLTSTIKAAKELLKHINYPIIMKIPQGTQGKGVMFADSFAGANSILDTLETLKQPFLIQEFVETNGTDVRAVVVGDEVVACMKRKSTGEDKRSNLHAGGSSEIITPSSEIKKISVKVAKALGAYVCGVDILEGVKSPLVIEANLSPGMQGITEATGVNVPEIIAKSLAEKTSKFLEEKKKGTDVKNVLTEEGIRSASPEIQGKVISKEDFNNIITTLDFRGERILLPKLVSASSKFKEGEEYVIEYKEGQINIKNI